MKILFNNHTPFSLAHGGAQVQIEQTMAALKKIGVEVEPLRWWDEQQTGDVLHHFARISPNLLRLAQAKGMRVVFSDFLTGQGSRSQGRLWLEKTFRKIAARSLPRGVAALFDWESYHLADACLAMTPYEAKLIAQLYGTPPARIHIVPNGVEEVFLNGQAGARGPWLVCTATITERKRVFELADAAVLAQTPLWVIGRPYSATDPYGQRFAELARNHPKFIRYEGAVIDRPRLAQIYREARGFVLLSTMESLSLSALEAASCGAPLLLSDLPWARTTFGQNAVYCRIGSSRGTARVLSQFYEAAPTLKAPPKALSWLDIAHQLRTIYEELLERPGSRLPSTSR